MEPGVIRSPLLQPVSIIIDRKPTTNRCLDCVVHSTDCTALRHTKYNIVYNYYIPGQPKTSDQLHRAIQRGDIEITRSILEARYILHSNMCVIEFTSFVSSPHYLDTPDIYGLSPLMNACRLGNTRSVNRKQSDMFRFADEQAHVLYIFTGCL